MVRVWWALLGFAAMAGTVGCAAPPSRVVQSINDGWRFVRHDVPNAQDAEVDDHAWKKVSLPHTWNLADGADGGDNYYRGPSWYRRRLPIDAKLKGRRFFLRFGAASLVADVYVNGHKAGSHRGGFGAFCFDVTDLVHVGGKNVVAVRVDNSKFDDIPPLSGDFTIYGGLYRGVSLLALDPLHISPLDDGSRGVYLRQTKLDDASATVQVTTRLRNDSPAQKEATVECRVLDQQGKTLVTQSGNQILASGADADAAVMLAIPDPHRWDGVRDPYLYRVKVVVRDGERIVDEIEQPLGLRTFRVDPKQGFVLNDRPYPVHGVNRHQDGGPKTAWAAGPAEVKRDYQLIREMGCTGVRLAHYQHPSYEYSLCDRVGLVTWAELALVNRIGPSSAFAKNAQQQLRELIKQNYNHPSICFWSLWNELGPRDQIVLPEQTRVLNSLNDLAHKLDPTRRTTAASHLPTTNPVHLIPDVIAFNKYFGWYSDAEPDWSAELDKMRGVVPPDHAIGMSEYGAGASVKQHEARPTTRPRTGGAWHPEEWQNIGHEQAWGAMNERPWLWGTFLWVMFDFASDGRSEGDEAGINDKGLVTRDRRVRKDAFYLYKANWTDEPFVHITSRRFTPRPAGPAEIKVYSNCESVELFIGGKSLGRKTAGNHVFVWPDVTLSSGKVKVRAVGVAGGDREQSRDEVVWTVSRSAATRLGTTQP